jgi:hypothetical protein
MSNLYVIGQGKGKARPATSWSSAAYDLERQPQRPGELCSEILIPRAACDQEVCLDAARSGLPEALWATLAVEGYRVADGAMRTTGLPAETLIELLDETAACNLHGVTETRLAAYARALCGAEERKVTRAIGPLLLRPSMTILAAWSLASSCVGCPVEDWARDCLRRRSGAVVAWEISAASSGQTLAEWAMVQAARRLRSRRTAPQTAA